jgi:hypothetical protein
MGEHAKSNCWIGIAKAQANHKPLLLVFRENVVGMAFWHALGATERVELSVFSLPTNGGG